MKSSNLVSISLLVVALSAATLPGVSRLPITEASRMWVDGTSSVHGWTCAVGEVEGVVTFDADAGLISQAVVTVPAASIECDSGTMNKKAARALDVEAHPTITYSLKTAAVRHAGDSLYVNATGALELAGTAKDVTSDLVGVPASGGGFTFTGSLPVRMSDFGIKPPTAMLGALKTGDDVTVRFEIAAGPESQ